LQVKQTSSLCWVTTLTLPWHAAGSLALQIVFITRCTVPRRYAYVMLDSLYKMHHVPDKQ
jgi:hypothetical protein